LHPASFSFFSCVDPNPEHVVNHLAARTSRT
jgi:hypothetical protein